MADVKISALPASGTPTDATLLATVSGGVTEKTTGTQVKTYLNDLLVRPTGGATSAAGGTGAGAVSTGASNAFFGHNAGNVNSTGYGNSFFGYNSGASNTTGYKNTFFGWKAGNLNTIGYYNCFFGYNAGAFNTEGNGNCFVGRTSGVGCTTGDNNCFFGRASGNNVTTGSNNLAFGYNIRLPVATGSNQMTIGNLIFGTGLDGTGVTVSSGNIGIGVPTPLAKLHIVSGGAIRLGNAAVAGAVVPTHTITFQDSTGTVYRVPCLV